MDTSKWGGKKVLIILLVAAVLVMCTIGYIRIIGLQATWSWNWRLRSWLYLIRGGLWTVFVIGYALAALGGYKPHKGYTILHIALIIGVYAVEQINIYGAFALMLAAVGVFFKNVTWTYKNKDLL